MESQYIQAKKELDELQQRYIFVIERENQDFEKAGTWETLKSFTGGKEYKRFTNELIDKRKKTFGMLRTLATNDRDLNNYVADWCKSDVVLVIKLRQRIIDHIERTKSTGGYVVNGYQTGIDYINLIFPKALNMLEGEEKKLIHSMNNRSERALDCMKTYAKYIEKRRKARERVKEGKKSKRNDTLDLIEEHLKFLAFYLEPAEKWLEDFRKEWRKEKLLRIIGKNGEFEEYNFESPVLSKMALTKLMTEREHLNELLAI